MLDFLSLTSSRPSQPKRQAASSLPRKRTDLLAGREETVTSQSSTRGMKNFSHSLTPDQDAEPDRGVNMMASELDRLRKENAELACSRSAIELENKHLREKNLEAEQDMEQFRLHANVLQHELQACKDDLFRLQPIVQVTDAQIVNQFDHVCEEVSSWVDEEISSYERRAGVLVTGTCLILDCGNPEIKTMLQKHPQASEYLLGSFIHQHLQRRVLGKHVYLFGLSQEEIAFLRTTEKRMAQLDPPRDDKTIRNWRSETLKAVTCNRRAHSMGYEVANEIFRALEQIFPIIRGQGDSLMRLFQKVVTPAIKLAMDMQVSCARYRFYPDMLEETELDFDKVQIGVLKQIGMIDVKTRKTLRLDSPVVADEHGYIGRPLFVVEPQLLRRNKGPEKSINLRQSTYLLQLDHPLEKRK